MNSSSVQDASFKLGSIQEESGDESIQTLEESSEDISDDHEAELYFQLEAPDMDYVDDDTPNPYVRAFDPILTKYRERFDKFSKKLEDLNLLDMSQDTLGINF